MSTTVRPLNPVFENVKSYYGKARVTTTKEGKTLYSYKTKVMVAKGGKLYRTQGMPCSPTTARHMREFARQEGFDRMTMGELRSLPVEQ